MSSARSATRSRTRTPFTLVLLLSLLTTMISLLPMSPANADEEPIQILDGSVDWRINENVWLQGSWNQIRNVEAGASVETIGGVEVFRLPIGEGSTYDPANGSAELALVGSITIGNTNRGNYTLTLDDLELTIVDGIASLSASVGGASGGGNFGGVPAPAGPFGPTDVAQIASWTVDASFDDGELTVAGGAPRTDVGPEGVARGFTDAFIQAMPDALRTWWSISDDNADSTGSQRKLLSPIDVTIGELEIPETPEVPEEPEVTPPSPDPTPVTRTEVSASITTNQVEPGGEVSISGNGFEPNEDLDVELRSDPVTIGTTVADGDGQASATVTIPEDTAPGTHTLALVGEFQEATATIVILGEASSGVVTDGYLDWGVKVAFRNYIRGNIANGETTATDGARDIDGGIFRFSNGSGTVDADEDSLDVSFDGSVRFTGHDGFGADGGPALDLIVENPRVVIDAGTGSLLLDVTSLPLEGTEVLEFDQVVFATLDVDGLDLEDVDGTLTLSDVEAVLTAEGAEAFAGFYNAGDELDPLTLVLAIDDAELEEPVSGGESPQEPEQPGTPAVPVGSDGSGQPETAPVAGSGSGAPTLPNTGVSTTALALLGGLLLAAGILTLRKRRVIA